MEKEIDGITLKTKAQMYSGVDNMMLAKWYNKGLITLTEYLKMLAERTEENKDKCNDREI